MMDDTGYPDFWDMEPDYPEPEPEAWHKSEITEWGGRVVVHESTNDNLDRGYPSEYASWDLTFETAEAAIKHTGKSRQGCGCRVDVFLNGEQI